MQALTGASNLLLAYAGALAITVYLSQELFTVDEEKDRLMRSGEHYDKLRRVIFAVSQYSLLLPCLMLAMFVSNLYYVFHYGDPWHKNASFFYAVLDWSYWGLVLLLAFGLFFSFRKFIHHIYEEALFYMESGEIE